MEDLVRYLNEIVDPTVKDFEEHPTSVRHAFLACVATYHAIDYLAYPNKRAANLKQEWRKKPPEFAIVDNVAHAFKHVIVGRRGDPRLKADEVMSRPPGIWGKAHWDLSRRDDPVGGVTLDNDRKVDVLDALRGAAAFLREQTKATQT
jgi:hypothetical protein